MAPDPCPWQQGACDAQGGAPCALGIGFLAEAKARARVVAGPHVRDSCPQALLVPPAQGAGLRLVCCVGLPASNPAGLLKWSEHSSPLDHAGSAAPQ